MKKALITLFALMLIIIAVFACNKSGDILIGISMPTRSSERWIKEGYELKDILEERGYKVELHFAEDDVPTQISQLEEMVSAGANVLVIAAVDGSALSGVIDQAYEDGISIIAYDRLLVDTASSIYYATFDNIMVGQLQAESLIAGLIERKSPSPWNIEIFAGSPDDTNAYYFFVGAMNVLQPYLDSGEIKILSGQTALEQINTMRWDGGVAERRMSELLETYYSDGAILHGVLSPFDDLSRGIISSLLSSGYTLGSENWPIITGQDAESASVKMIISGEQFSTVFKDTRELARVAANMIEALLEGKAPEINDTTTYHNNVNYIPSFILQPILVTAENYREFIIDSGYLTPDDIR